MRLFLNFIFLGLFLAFSNFSVALNNAMNFNRSSSQHIIATGFTAPTSFTVEAWINLDDTTRQCVLLGSSASGPNVHAAPQLVVENGSFTFSNYDGSVKSAFATTTLVPNTWYHVAITASNGGTAKIYINGVLEGTSATLGTLFTGLNRWYIGSQTGSGGTPYFDGQMDNFRIWSTVRTASEIFTDMNNDLGTATGLLLNYKFNQTSGNVVDQSGNGKNGTIYGAPTYVTSTSPSATLSAFISSHYNSHCYGTNAGSLSATANGGTSPFTYAWSNGGNSASINSLAIGTYTVTITDANSLTSTATATIEQPAAYSNQALTSNKTFCSPGDSATISTASSEKGVKYSLYTTSGGFVEGPKSGTGSSLSFNTGAINSATNYYLYARKDTALSTIAGNALTFTGGSDHVNCGNDTSLNIASNLTLEAWIYPTSWKANSYDGSVIEKTNSTKDGYMMRVGNSGSIDFYIGTGSWQGIATATNVVSLNTWSHIAATYDGSTFKIYVNGVLVKSGSGSGAISSSSASLLLGSSAAYPTRGFPGRIDEVRIWNDIRTPTEISNNTNSLFTGSESNLVSLYKFEDGPGNMLYDKTSSGNNGTLTNMNNAAWVVGLGVQNNCPTFLINDTASIFINGPLANLVITEIMYNPPESGTDSTEYIEIYNNDSVAVNLNGYYLSQGVNFTFPNILLDTGEYLILTVDSNSFKTRYGKSAIQWTSGGLSNGGEDIVIKDSQNRTVDSVDYENSNPWPANLLSSPYLGPHGGGTSIVLCDPNSDNSNGSNWKASTSIVSGKIVNSKQVYGSPGEQDNACTPFGASVTTTKSKCKVSLADGTATIRVSGGIPNYTYAWSNGTTITGSSVDTNVITGLQAGNYSVLVTDGLGQKDTVDFSIAEDNNLSLSIIQLSSIQCHGDSTATLQRSYSGGTYPFGTTSWSNGDTTEYTTVNAGTHYLEFTDSNSCSAYDTVTITQPSVISPFIIADSSSNCNQSTGALTVIATGGSHNGYNYNWSTGATTASISGLAKGNYSVTVSLPFSGCGISASSKLENKTGKAEVWTNHIPRRGGTNFYGIAHGNGVFVTVGDSIRVSNNGSTWNSYACPTSVSFRTVCFDDSLFVAGGNSGEIYTSHNGISWTAQTSPTSSSWFKSAAGNGTYILFGSSGDVITSTDGNTWTKNSKTFNGAYRNSVSFGDSVFVITGKDSIHSSFNGINWLSKPIESAEEFRNAEYGNGKWVVFGKPYIHTSVDGFNWTLESSSALIGRVCDIKYGAGIFTMSTVREVGFREHLLTSTDGINWVKHYIGSHRTRLTGIAYANNQFVYCSESGLISSAPAAVFQSATVSIAIDSAISCSGGSNGVISVSASAGLPPYTYSWSTSDTTAQVNNLSTGNYSVTVTDCNGDTATANLSLGQPLKVIPEINIDSATNCGQSTGALSVVTSSGSSGYSYSWSNGDTTASIVGLAKGVYTLTLTDSLGCSLINSDTIKNKVSFLDTWAEVEGSVANRNMVNVTYGNGIYVAVGDSILTSQDGKNWNHITSVTSIGWKDVVYGNGIFVAIGSNGIMTSSNGTTWTLQTIPTSGTNWKAAAFGGGTFVAVGENGTQNVMTSSNGTTWTLRSQSASREWKHVEYGGGVFVALGDDLGNLAFGKYLMSSSNGITWTTRTIPNKWHSKLAYGNNKWIIVANDGTISSSSNAQTWSSLTNTGLKGSQAITYGDGHFVNLNWYTNSGTGMREHVVHTSSNGTTWTKKSSSVVYPSAITFGKHEFIALDVFGKIHYASGIKSLDSGITLKVDSTISCSGGSNGVLSVNAAGGVPPYSYVWSTNDTVSSVSGLSAGSYTVTVTDCSGDTATSSIVLSQPSAVVATATLDSNITCNGFSNGGATASATGGTGAYSYAWSNGATTTSITGIAAGTFKVTITDSKGCTDTSSTSIGQSNALVASASTTTNVSCNGGANGKTTASGTGGTGSYSYSWSTSGTSAVESGLAAGTYYVTITDSLGCYDSASTVVTEPSSLIASAITDTNVSCNGGSNGKVTASGTGGTGAYTYAWNNSATSASIAGLGANSYYVTITDANGCFDSASTSITQPVAIVASASVTKVISCNGGSNGEATASATGGTGSYTYSWNTSETTALETGLSAGTYYVSITDANNCTDSASVVVSQPAILVATATLDSNVTCNGFSNGGATASATGGTGAYSYAWSNGATTTSITGIAAGTYKVTITDSKGCTDTSSTSIGQSNALVASASTTTNVSCYGGTNGKTTASGTGGTGSYSYSWSTSGTSAVESGLAAGSYYVTITDSLGCYDSASTVVTEPTALITSAVVDSNVSCNGQSNGGATASALGGTGTYTYSWSNLATSASITSVGANSYYVTITDANGCFDSSSVIITQPVALIASAVVDSNVSCSGLSNGGATASATGGTGSYMYLWSNSATTASISGVTKGKNYVTITDANGCTDSATANIIEPTKLIASSIMDSASACSTPTGGATASAVGGSGSYTYLWSNLATTASITGVAAGKYSVTITDANSCNDTSSISISNKVSPIALVSLDSNVSCFGFTNGGATASATSGTQAYSYSWSNSSTMASISGVGVGTYYVTITDANGCFDSASVKISQPTILIASTVLDSNVKCFGLATGGATASATGGNGTYNYLWSNSASTATISGVVANSYKVTVTDMNNCSDTSSLVISQPLAALSSVITIDSTVTCAGLTNGGASSGVMGGTSPYTFKWSNAETTSSISGLAIGTYYLTVTDTNSCSVVDSAVIGYSTGYVPPTLTFPNPSASCDNAGPITLSGATPTGGVYSGTNVSSGDFLPSSAGAGTDTLYYTYKDSIGCITYDTAYIVVKAAPAVTFTNLNSVCVDNGAFPITNGSPTGGTYSGNGVFMSNFYPDSATAGSHSINYVYTDANNCSDSASQNQVVNALPMVSYTAPNNWCMNNAALKLNTGTPVGGTYTVNGVTDTMYSTTTAGMDTIVYSFTDTNSCTNTDTSFIQADTVPVVSFLSLADLCVGSASYKLVEGMPIGGMYSGNGVSTGSYNPAKVGTDTLTYVFADSNNCSDKATQTITVNALPVVAISTQADVCENTPSFALTGGTPVGGTYSGGGVISGNYDASKFGFGTDNIKYVYSDGNNCKDSSTTTLVVNSVTKATLNFLGYSCDNSAAINLFSSGLPTGGTFGGTGVSGTDFDPTLAGSGTHSISYIYTNANSCIDSTKGDLIVEASPIFNIEGDTIGCGPGPNAPVLKTTLLGMTYHWSNGSNMDTAKIFKNGPVWLKVTDPSTQKLCSNYDTVNVKYDEVCVGLDENLNSTSVSYYPNPSNGTFNYDIKGFEGLNIEVSIISANGKQVYRDTWNEVSDKTGEIELIGMESGIYFITLSTERGNVMHRLNILR